MNHPPQLGILFKFLRLHREFMFVFDDGKACLTYEHDVGDVMYLVAPFDKSKGQVYNSIVAANAKQASMN